MAQKLEITDEMINAKWRSMLKVFKTLITEWPKPEKIKKELEDLKTAAINSILTPRQTQGIIARCDNYINGTYGNTKTEANVAYGKTALNGTPPKS